ncbi:hypothetical protein OAI27_09400 [Planktomarina temperata]|nr:hypothetical protein [Planktomarina temperata]
MSQDKSKRGRSSLAITTGWVDTEKDNALRPLAFEHAWKMYKETNDVEALAEVCEHAPFFGQSEMGPEIAKLLRQNQSNTKYEKLKEKIFLDRLVRYFGERLGSTEAAYEEIAELEIFKSNQGKTKGNVKDASVLKDDHNKWLRVQRDKNS